MSRTREWIKFGTLVGITVALAVAFTAIVDFPRSSEAQQPTLKAVADRPAPLKAAQPVQDLGNAFVAVAEAVRPAVVRIEAESRPEPRVERRRNLPPPFDQFFPEGPDQIQPRPRRGQGSGFIISPDGFIVTNNHVVEGFDRFDVSLFDGRQFKATVVGGDDNTDVAVIKIDAKNLPTVALGDSDELQVGEWVLAIGNPLGEAFSFTVTAGIVSGRGRLLNGLGRTTWSIQDFIQTDAVINPGNSGGPLVNIRGQVIGVNSAIASRSGFYTGYSFAIPMKLARTVADQLIKEGKVTRAALGVQIRPADQEDAAFVGLDAIRGVVINDFTNDQSPAMRAGLRPGDVIVEVDGEEVSEVPQLQQLIGFKRPGDEVDVTVLRQGGERHTIAVRLTEANTLDEPAIASTERESPREAAPYEAKLGIRVAPVEERLVSQIGVEGEGLMITGVDPDGAARDKLREANPRRDIMDIITHVNGERVRSRADLDLVLTSASEGEVVSLRLLRATPTPTGTTWNTGVVRVRIGGEEI